MAPLTLKSSIFGLGMTCTVLHMPIFTAQYLIKLRRNPMNLAPHICLDTLASFPPIGLKVCMPRPMQIRWRMCSRIQRSETIQKGLLLLASTSTRKHSLIAPNLQLAINTARLRFRPRTQLGLYFCSNSASEVDKHDQINIHQSRQASEPDFQRDWKESSDNQDENKAKRIPKRPCLLGWKRLEARSSSQPIEPDFRVQGSIQSRNGIPSQSRSGLAASAQKARVQVPL